MTDDEAITALLAMPSDKVQKDWDSNALWLYGAKYAVELFRSEDGDTDGYAYAVQPFDWSQPMTCEWRRCDEDCQDRMESDPRDWSQAVRFMLAWIGTPAE